MLLWLCLTLVWPMKPLPPRISGLFKPTMLDEPGSRRQDPFTSLSIS
jgi:hypothetical protein